jgi:hypothetical protein
MTFRMAREPITPGGVVTLSADEYSFAPNLARALLAVLDVCLEQNASSFGFCRDVHTDTIRDAINAAIDGPPRKAD